MKVRILTLVGLVLILASYAFPFWSTYLSSPIFGYTRQVYIKVMLAGYVDYTPPDALMQLNIAHHYVGLPPLEPEKMIELKLIPLLPAGLAAVYILYMLGKIRLRWVALITYLALIGGVAYFQYWLYNLGHSIQPGAPIKVEPFTPIVMGTYQIANFTAFNILDVGFWLLAAAPIFAYLGERFKI
ncbi:hypothetical protein [Pyrobaculum calidifontis]|uniref:Uncharacterized protein n=1 Tax=Pyrobaculum calidifontis (strain DSM 21063 / JCM 11548 / VA1) TaxID=410359 RepID=A3MXH9_PYRCJ|nr:hypothetical protein [Pyrobaculum calidifontis]ABO09346.1 conserved hypothetical protein [Pyrobaculum calidifontis JCM 11548]